MKLTRNLSLCNALLLMIAIVFTAVTAKTAYAAIEVHDISSCAELLAIDDVPSNNLNNYRLTQDIDCSETDFESLFFGTNDTTAYRGTFNGQGHAITNLTIAAEGFRHGLFSRTGNGAVIKNLRLEGGSVSATREVGGLIGYAFNTEVINVISDLDVTSEFGFAGGLIGNTYNEDGTASVTYSSSSGSVSGDGQLGGLIGYAEVYQAHLIISKSFATGDVAGSNPESAEIGGLIGAIFNGSRNNEDPSTIIVVDSYATGDVTNGSRIGGLIGGAYFFSEDTETVTNYVERTYATGEVTGLEEVGGLIGYVDVIDDESNQSMVIRDSFTTSPINLIDPELETAYHGAVVGFIESEATEIFNTYYDSSASDYTADCAEGVFTGECFDIDLTEDSDYFFNTTTVPPFMVEESIWWDFESVWAINEDTYPTLLEYNMPDQTDLNGDGIPDVEQPYVAGYTSPVTGRIVAIEVGENCEVTSDDMVQESQLAAQDTNFDFDNGLWDFEAECDASTTTVSLFYYDVNKAGLVLRKYNSNTQQYSTVNQASLTERTINGHTVTVATYEVADGGELDTDGATNGFIRDPAGLARAVSGAQAATLATTGSNTNTVLELSLSLIFIGSATTLSRKYFS